MKRWTALALALVMALCLSAPALAAEADAASDAPEQTETAGQELLYETFDLSDTLQAGGLGYMPRDGVAVLALEDRTEVKQILQEVLRNRQDSVDIGGYMVPRTEIAALFYGMIDEEPDLFYVNGFSFAYDPLTDTVIDLSPKYDNSYNEEDSQKLEEAVAQALECVNDAMTPEQKALALHDYLAQHIQYTSGKYNAYNALVERKCVCQGYTLAYALLLKRCGIENFRVSSEKMNHTWNIIRLGENWYHVDVTWDDPVWDDAPYALNREGFVGHTYFLLSDNGFPEEYGKPNHYDYVSDIACTDTAYESGQFWLDSHTAVIFRGDTAYYIAHPMNSVNTLIRHSANGEEQVVYELPSQWYYNYALSGNSGALYFNDSASVYRLALQDGAEIETLVTVDAPEELFGSHYVDGAVDVTVGTTFEASQTRSYPVQPLPPEEDPPEEDPPKEDPPEEDPPKEDPPEEDPPEEEEPTEITVKEDSVYRLEDSCLTGFEPKTDLRTLKKGLVGTTVVAKNSNGETLGDDVLIGTGCVLSIGGKPGTEIVAVLKGDVDGDGLCTTDDVTRIRQHLLQLVTLTAAQTKAAQITAKDSAPSLEDVIAVRMYLLHLTDTLNV